MGSKIRHKGIIPPTVPFAADVIEALMNRQRTVMEAESIKTDVSQANLLV